MVVDEGVKGYIAALLDLKGRAYVMAPIRTRQAPRAHVGIAGVTNLKMARDLSIWIGAGAVQTQSGEFFRKGCSIHCDQPHVHGTRSTSRFTITGWRATIVLYTLEDYLFTWEEKFRGPFLSMLEIEPTRNTRRGDIEDQMKGLGWDIP